MFRFASLALLFLVTGIAAAQTDAPIPRPSVKPGDSWGYRRTDYNTGQHSGRIQLEVTFANDRVIQLVQRSPSKDEDIDVTMSAEWNQINSGNSGVFNPHSGILRFPLRTGDSWTSTYDVKFPREGDYEVKHDRKVRAVGWEDIEVPAGKFRALKVVSEGTFFRVDRGVSGTVTEAVWYVPQVKRFVKWTFENAGPRGRVQWWGWELLDYKVQ